MRAWRAKQGLSFPIQPDRLISELARFNQAKSRGEPDASSSGGSLSRQAYVVGGALKMVGVQFKSVLDSTSPGGDVLDIRAKLEAWLQKHADAGGPKAAMASEFHIFQLTTTLYTISSSGIKSMICSMALAFAVLILFFGNRRVASLAFFSICCTSICAMGFISVAGWAFGILESICVVRSVAWFLHCLSLCFHLLKARAFRRQTILVGIVVDYVVHIGVEYLAHDGTSTTRTVSALKHMGISVAGGWVTSVMSAVFLLFCTITFFVKFGIFMCATLALSLVFSLAFFPVLLIELGPSSVAEVEKGSLMLETLVPVRERPSSLCTAFACVSTAIRCLNR